MSVKDTSNVDKLLKRLASLNSKVIEVGILGSEDSEILMIAGVNEFGQNITVTDKMRAYLHSIGIHLKKETTQIVIPERSFIRAGFDSNKQAIQTQGDRLIEKVIDMTLDENSAAELLGDIAKGKIQEFAINLSSPKNADITVEIKGSSNPLIATGKMIDSISYQVKG